MIDFWVQLAAIFAVGIMGGLIAFLVALWLEAHQYESYLKEHDGDEPHSW